MLKADTVLQTYYQDTGITDIVIHDTDKAFINKNGVFEEIASPFSDKNEIEEWIRQILNSKGRKYDPDNDHLIDVGLLSGQRVNIVRGEISPNGTVISIRTFSRRYTLEQLVENGALTAGAAGYLKAAIQEKRNILVCGGTGSGKTTLMNAMSMSIPLNERIVSIEDTLEIFLPHQNWSRMEAYEERKENGTITIRRLVANAMRMIPDRVIIGECRSKEVFDLVQAANSGHKGMITSLHANSARDGLVKLENLYMMASTVTSLLAIRSLISKTFETIIHISRHGPVRKITEIIETTGLEGEIITTATVFKLEKEDLVSTGMIPSFWHQVSDKYGDFMTMAQKR